MLRFQLDAGSQTRRLNRPWEMCVGSCHAATALREDYRRQLTECRRELGFRYLRFHGLFDDDMSVLTKSVFSGEYVLSFANVDNIFDFLLSIGMKPFIELSFMPSCLKSGEETIFHYRGNVTPPSDEPRWEWLIRSFADHLIERYGRDEVRSWFFEVWNEPNLGGENGFAGGRFWSGTMEQYYRLYEITARSLKSADKMFRVGGPATSNNAHIPDMIRVCRERKIPLDFVSTHHYPTDVVLGYGVEDSQNFVTEFNRTDPSDKDALRSVMKQFLTFQSGIWAKVDRGVLTQMARRAREEAGGLPLYYTEWNSLAGLESDGAFGASFAAKTCMDNDELVEGYAYWTFSDIFEERAMMSAAFHGGYGLMTRHGVKKAAYRAFEILHKLEDTVYSEVLREGTVDCYVCRSSDRGIYQILAVNHQSLMHEVKTETVCLRLGNLPGKPLSTADVLRVDEIRSNALAKWNELGSPEYLDEVQLCELQTASCMKRETMEIAAGGHAAELTLEIPPQGIVLATVYVE